MADNTSVKDRLVTAAFDLFDERGFDATTVDDIAERAGVGRTTFFRTFRSKEDVIFPDHEALIADVAARLDAATPATARLAIREASRMVLDHYLDEGEQAMRRYALTRTVPALNARERAGVLKYTQLFTLFGERILGMGTDGGLRAELLGNAVVTAHNHVLRRWLRGETTDPREELDAALSLVLPLFLKPPPGDPAPALTVMVVRGHEDVEALTQRVTELLS